MLQRVWQFSDDLCVKISLVVHLTKCYFTIPDLYNQAIKFLLSEQKVHTVYEAIDQ